MKRYDIGNVGNSEFEPGSRRRVLRNTQSITSTKRASAIESDLLVVAQQESLTYVETATRFTPNLLAKMHKLWLGSFYPMAGEYRVVDLSKGGFTFCHALYVPEQMERFGVKELARCTPCAGPISEVAEKLAIVHAEFLMIHPFRDGNGRLARWLADLMALQAGHPAPDYSLEGARRKDYFAAVRRGFLGDYGPLAALFVSWIERALQEQPPMQPPKQ